VGEVVLLRHGQTAWSRDGRHTGRTDIPLDEAGEAQARALTAALTGFRFALVLVSPLRRARRTAELAGLGGRETDPDLAEWDYGLYDGRTTAEIREERPGWSLWRDGVPLGESIEQVATRADRVLARVRPRLADGDVALVGHGHALRILAARWIGQPAPLAARLQLGSGTVSVLGHEHEDPTVHTWNCPP
jgi:broad specificity phosphatase PhoE